MIYLHLFFRQQQSLKIFKTLRLRFERETARARARESKLQELFWGATDSPDTLYTISIIVLTYGVNEKLNEISFLRAFPSPRENFRRIAKITKSKSVRLMLTFSLLFALPFAASRARREKKRRRAKNGRSDE